MSLSSLDTQHLEYSLKPLLWSRRSWKICSLLSLQTIFPPPLTIFWLQQSPFCASSKSKSVSLRGTFHCCCFFLDTLPFGSLCYPYLLWDIRPDHAIHAHLLSPTALLFSFINPSPAKIPSYIHAFSYLLQPAFSTKNVTFTGTETVPMCLYHHWSPRFPVQCPA